MVETATDSKFPYQLEDLIGWTIKRKDGVYVRWSLTGRQALSMGDGTGGKSAADSALTFQKAGYSSVNGSLSSWCHHDPAKLPTFVGKNKKGNVIELFIADAAGVKAHKYEFDTVIDCGDVIDLKFLASNTVFDSTDPALAARLEKFTTVKYKALRVIKIDWLDRDAPKVVPAFWPALAEELKGRVLINCQGGHGRSGSALVNLMMVMSDYDALDAITHLRAIHCARAIESTVQHKYINTVAEFLGREANALQAEAVPNFRDRFLSLTSKTSKPYRDRLEGK